MVPPRAFRDPVAGRRPGTLVARLGDTGDADTKATANTELEDTEPIQLSGTTVTVADKRPQLQVIHRAAVPAQGR